jgi:hypothetical protein
MDRPDLLSRVQQRARLHGPNESRRAIRAVVDALVEAVPVAHSRRLAMRVATETGAGLPAAALTDHSGRSGGCHTFIAEIAQRLFIDEPNAAFLARVVFGELNSAGHGITPAAVSSLAPPDLRPLLGATISPDPRSLSSSTIEAETAITGPREAAPRRPATAPVRIRVAAPDRPAATADRTMRGGFLYR